MAINQVPKLDFAKIVAVALPTDKLVDPFSGNMDHTMIDQIQNYNYKGISNKAGGWRIEPAAGWLCERLAIGLYKVTHNLGHTDTCLSVGLVVIPGSFTILEHTPTYFMIQTILDQQPTDLDFSFVLTKVIYQPALP